jgi:Domain of unknown function (DUF4201)
MQEKCDEAEARNRELRERNIVLHNAIGSWSGIDLQSAQAETVSETEYLSLLVQVDEIRRRAPVNDELSKLEQTLSERKLNLQELKDKFRSLQVETLKNAETFRSRKPIPLKTINEIEDQAIEKAAELDEAQRAHITLKRRLSCVDKLIRKKVMDFEQLKIENQVLKDSFANNQEELTESKSKLSTLVHLKAHHHARIATLKIQRAKQAEELQRLIATHRAQREAVIATKKDRDRLRASAADSRRLANLAKNTLLVQDVAKNEKLINDLETQVQALTLTLST